MFQETEKWCHVTTQKMEVKVIESIFSVIDFLIQKLKKARPQNKDKKAGKPINTNGVIQSKCRHSQLKHY